jgi:hypothetical protein
MRTEKALREGSAPGRSFQREWSIAPPQVAGWVVAAIAIRTRKAAAATAVYTSRAVGMPATTLVQLRRSRNFDLVMTGEIEQAMPSCNLTMGDASLLLCRRGGASTVVPPRASTLLSPARRTVGRMKKRTGE